MAATQSPVPTSSGLAALQRAVTTASLNLSRIQSSRPRCYGWFKAPNGRITGCRSGSAGITSGMSEAQVNNVIARWTAELNEATARKRDAEATYAAALAADQAARGAVLSAQATAAGNVESSRLTGQANVLSQEVIAIPRAIEAKATATRSASVAAAEAAAKLTVARAEASATVSRPWAQIVPFAFIALAVTFFAKRRRRL